MVILGVLVPRLLYLPTLRNNYAAGKIDFDAD